jgi:hypothetical protein
MQASSTAPPRSGLVGQVSPLRCGTRVVTQLSHRSVCPAHQNLVGVGVSVRLSEMFAGQLRTEASLLAG